MGLSVSRVGGNAQTKAMKKVAGRLRLDLAQYRELAAFAQFGSDLDKATQAQLIRGERMVEILKQDQYEPLPVSREVTIIYVGIKGHIDDIPAHEVRGFEKEFYAFMDKDYPDVGHEIEKSKVLSDEVAKKIDTAVEIFKKKWRERKK